MKLTTLGIAPYRGRERRRSSDAERARYKEDNPMPEPTEATPEPRNGNGNSTLRLILAVLLSGSVGGASVFKVMEPKPEAQGASPAALAPDIQAIREKVHDLKEQLGRHEDKHERVQAETNRRLEAMNRKVDLLLWKLQIPNSIGDGSAGGSAP